MKKLLTLSLTFCITFGANAQKQKSPQDSIKLFYNEMFNVLKTSYLNRKTVDWKSVESETRNKLQTYDSFEKSLTEIKPFFDKIGANHCLIFYKNRKYSGTGKLLTKDDYSEQWKKKFDTKPVFEAKMIDEKYAYILMPGMLFFDLSPENIHRLAQPLYDQIAEIKSKNKPKGWILDLRFNTGGNSSPMLLALYDLLGDNVVWGTLDGNKKMTAKIRLEKGKQLDGSKKPSFINSKGEPADNTKVAVITGPFTGSSGEVTALAFKGRPNTIFIGEKTYGATTTNTQYPLPFDTTMAITIGYDSDRNGNYYEQIAPDIIVSKQDNLDNLLLDGNVLEAVKFFEGKS